MTQLFIDLYIYAGLTIAGITLGGLWTEDKDDCKENSGSLFCAWAVMIFLWAPLLLWKVIDNERKERGDTKL